MYTSIHIEEYESEARDTKLGPEEITRDIPNVGEDALQRSGRARHHPHRRRGHVRRYSGRQGHPEGRDRADGRGAPAARDLRRKGARGARHLPARAARRVRHRLSTSRSSPARTGDELDRRASISWSACYIAQKRKISRRRQDGRPPRQQGCRFPHPAGGGYAVPAGRHAARHRAEPAGRTVPYEHRTGAGGSSGLWRQRRLGWKIATPVFDGAHEEDICEMLRSRPACARTARSMLYDGRTGEQFDNPVTVGYMYYPQAASSG